MDDAIPWSQVMLSDPPLAVVAATLALSLLGAPWLRLGAERRHRRTTSLVNRWRLFAWLHPFWAGLLKWSLIGALLTIAGCLLGPAVWHARILEMVWTEVTQLVGRLRPPR